MSSCTSSTSITVTQSLNPPQLSVANPALLTCTSPSQTLSGNSTVSGVQFAWATIIGTDTTVVGNGSTLLVSVPGTYFLLGVSPANNCPNAISVNVSADQAPPTANAGTPFTLDCAGETAPLNGSGSGAPSLVYQWSTQDGHFVSGAGSPNPLIDLAGAYLLSVTNPANGCTDSDEVTILPEIPVAYASVTQPTCQEEQGTVLVDSVTGLSDPILYSLNNSQPGSLYQFDNLVPGIYTLQVQGGNGCSASAVLTVNAPALVEITLAPEATIGLGHSYLIEPGLNINPTDIASVIWTPSTGLECDTCLSTLAKPFSTTEYQVLVVSNAGCEARGTITLTVDKTRKVYGPNIFSPDEDGSNDVFTIFADPFTVVRIKSLQVYSRWGEEVFELLDFATGDTNLGWDGTFKGQKLNPAVFVWQAVVEFVDGKEELFTGDVTIQR
ncbi:MAG: gliding motility-associated C-terminal domain-containing protein [Phycisphaerae bacterium]|nr:gliding motility-associated C-terminal domain-containing protein [Saprospiraceae bacterium]